MQNHDTSNDDELRQYVYDLKTNVLGSYCTVVAAAQDSQMSDQILAYAQDIFNFMQACTSGQIDLVSTSIFLT